MQHSETWAMKTQKSEPSLHSKFWAWLDKWVRTYLSHKALNRRKNDFIMLSKQTRKGRTRGRGGNKPSPAQGPSRIARERRRPVPPLPLLPWEEACWALSLEVPQGGPGRSLSCNMELYTPDSNSKTTFPQHCQHTLVVQIKTRRI